MTSRPAYSEVVVNADTGCNSTPDEPWMVERERNHHYCEEADFAHETLGKGPGKLLIVGSPIFEVKEFIARGWDVTYVDVRIPPPLKARVVISDICEFDLEPGTFDAASSTCVICHAGLGRYGDPLVSCGDDVALRNIARALKKGAFATITFGVVADISVRARVDTCHRIYSEHTVLEMCREAGFEVLEKRILNAASIPPKWIDHVPTFREDNVIGRYIISAHLRKC